MPAFHRRRPRPSRSTSTAWWGCQRRSATATRAPFAAAFYGALAYGRNVKTAFELGRNRIDLAGLRDEDVPQLLAPNSDPATVTFVLS